MKLNAVSSVLTLVLSTGWAVEATSKVTIPAGTIIGSLADGIEHFRGIPYAQPPIGALRLRPPKPLKKFGTHVDTGVGPSCPQYVNVEQPATLFNRALGVPGVAEALFFGASLGQETEDCLTISVMRPQNTKPGMKLPVLFWIHGGGFQLGSGQNSNASVLIPRAVSQGKPFILVTINYRLGGFGFLGGKQVLADGASNLGLLDQRLALEWVADNIAAFGGDSNAVTIWGESAGGRSVFDHMALYDGNNRYKGHPLFRAAIMNSGSIIPTDPVDGANAQAIFDTVVEEAGCGKVADQQKLNCLRGLDYQTFANATFKVPSFTGYYGMALSYAPRPDGHTITASPEVLARSGNYAAVPMIVGNQENEGTVFATFAENVTTKADLISYLSTVQFRSAGKKRISDLINTYSRSDLEDLFNVSANDTYPEFKRLAAILGDIEFILTSRVLLDLYPKSVPAWSYLATYGRDTPIVGTFHTADLPRMFAKTDEISRSIQDRIISFVHTLNPNNMAGASVRWPSWQESKQLLEFGANSTGLLDGNFRQRSFKYIRDHLSAFRH